MATNKIAADKARITFQLTKKEREILEQLAAQSDMTLSAYVLCCLQEVMDAGTIFVRRTFRRETTPVTVPQVAPARGIANAADADAVRARVLRRMSSASSRGKQRD
jgi:hypothetical protein